MIKELVIVLYGSTGDLSFRKLLPAIVSLKQESKLPAKTKVLALGRRDFDTNSYLEFVKEHNSNLNIDELTELVHYVKMQITERDDYQLLFDELGKYCNEETRVVHYLSVAPDLMLPVANNISDYNIVKKGEINHSLIFEKPFGSSYKTSHLINEQLWTNFDESQIYRMDHYLGKQLVSNLLNLRFENKITSSIMNPKNIKNIDIVVKEEVGILNRGNFYDVTGASKDMLQSHVLQVLSLLLMNQPKKLEHKYIIDQKVKVLKNIKYDKEHLIFGQYSGYQKESNVKPDSLTETLVSVDFSLKGIYKGVKINVLTGKKLSSKETYIKITLKDDSALKLNMYPKVSIQLNTNIMDDLIDINHEFNNVFDEYAELMLAAINYKKELFVRWDEIEESWKLVDNILLNKKELVIYTNELK